MISGKLFRQVLDKILKSPVSQEARVQIAFPNSDYYDVRGIQLMENKIVGARETHRIVITIQPEQWRMGEAVKKLGDWSIK
jgi:hypothetical protein